MNNPKYELIESARTDGEKILVPLAIVAGYYAQGNFTVVQYDVKRDISTDLLKVPVEKFDKVMNKHGLGDQIRLFTQSNRDSDQPVDLNAPKIRINFAVSHRMVMGSGDTELHAPKLYLKYLDTTPQQLVASLTTGRAFDEVPVAPRPSRFITTNLRLIQGDKPDAQPPV